VLTGTPCCANAARSIGSYRPFSFVTTAISFGR
jgi:hypothetical protein